MASKRTARFGKKKTEGVDTLTDVDTLTGLVNRSVVSADIAKAIAAERDVALLSFGVNGFGEVNERYGRDSGDDVLKRLAQSLKAKAPEGAVIGRLGGDEFCVALFGSREATPVLRELVNSLHGPISTEDYTFNVELSAGIVVAGGSESPVELFQHADVAIDTAKAQPGVTTIEFDRIMHMQWGRDCIRRDELTTAIEEDQIELYFQPDVDLRDGSVIGAEALLRWNHPTNGVITAGEFIDDLERFKLLPKLVSILFEQAEHLANAMATKDDPFTMRLNVSPEQLLDLSFPTHLEQAIERTPVQWCLEVNERTIATATPRLRSVFDQVRKIGAEIAVDDFGTGYSSVYEMQGMPVDAIKVDPVFVQALEMVDDPSTSVASVLLNLARAVEIDAVAEGVESERQRAALLELGCYRAQGYLFGAPLSAQEFLTKWSRYKILAVV